MFKLRNRPSTPARTLMSPINDFLRGYKENGEALLAHPFKGITTDGHVVPGLFPIQRTGGRRRRSRMRRTRSSRR